VNRIFPLLLDDVTARPQFDDQRVFVELLIQAGLQFVQHRHRRTNDVFGDFLVEHKVRFQC
jgi:hypothetical protein